jgi:uncharacterized protein (TIGR00156 family)
MKTATGVAVLILSSALAAGAWAGFSGPGAVSAASTVKAVADMRDDTRVTLEGHLVKEIRPEHYMFKDGTGEIEVEIDDEDFRGAKITPETKVRLVGEVDKDWTSTTVDVDLVEVVQ